MLECEGKLKVTLKDIAEKANVSISTVSRVISNSSASVHEETRHRIMQIAEELGYHKINKIKQKNENFTEKRIGLILNDMKDKYHDDYFSEIIYGIERELIAQGCILDFTYDAKELHPGMYAELRKSHAGILCVGPISNDFLREFSEQVPQVLSVGGTPSLEINYVTVDFCGAALKAMEYLLSLGHREIAFIGGSVPGIGVPMDQEERYFGYEKALVKNNIPIVSDWIQDGYFELTGGYEAMKKILQADTRPTALFTASDRMAYGAYKAIQEHGLTVPDDISVISFDNIEMSEFVNPALTTIHVPKEEMGRIAVKFLLQHMEGGVSLPLTTYLPTRLMVRESCSKKRGNGKTSLPD